MTETWKAVPGFEGAYEVSDLGRVRALSRLDALGRRIKGRVLRPGPHQGGYACVSLYCGGERRGTAVHTLVAEAFLGPRPPGAEVLHNDGNAGRSPVSNLRYGTHKENEADKDKHGTRLLGEAHGSAKVDARAVSEIRRLKGAVPQAVLAARFGVTFSTISAIQLRKSWRHV